MLIQVVGKLRLWPPGIGHFRSQAASCVSVAAPVRLPLSFPPPFEADVELKAMRKINKIRIYSRTDEDSYLNPR